MLGPLALCLLCRLWCRRGFASCAVLCLDTAPRPCATRHRHRAAFVCHAAGWYDDELTKQRVDWKQGFDVGAQDGDLDGQGLDGVNQARPPPARAMYYHAVR